MIHKTGLVTAQEGSDPGHLKGDGKVSLFCFVTAVPLSKTFHIMSGGCKLLD